MCIRPESSLNVDVTQRDESNARLLAGTGTRLCKMASNFEDTRIHWGQLIFTHVSKPPVLISKESVRLGRKEGDGQVIVARPYKRAGD